MENLMTSRSPHWLRRFPIATHWKSLLLILALSIGLSASAQTITVTGVVEDPDGEPLIGAAVRVSGTQMAVNTDLDGNFALKNVSPNAILEVSYVGFEMQMVKVDGRTNIKIVLETSANTLEDVVVIGYGGTRARRDLTGSVSSVTGATIAAVPVTSAAVALQGKVAGVQVTTVDGQPGADVNIRIRGTATVSESGDSNPLYIVDGFQVDNINDIPPTDIQSIDILKDASMTAIYGAKGGNGVVVVTTKSAKEGKATVSFNGSMTLSHISKQLDLMNTEQFVDYQFDRLASKGISSSNSATRLYYSTFGMPEDIDVYSRAITHDWQDEVMGNTPLSYSANLSIGGGNEQTRYNVSLTQSNDKGIINQTGVSRTNINTKINSKLSRTLTFTYNPKLTYREDNGKGGEKVGTGGIIDVLKYRPTNGMRELGSWGDDVIAEYYTDENAFAWQNPVSDIERNLYKKKAYTISNQAALEWKPIKGLTLRTEGTYSFGFTQTDEFWAVGTTKATSNNEMPVAEIDKKQTNKYVWTNTATYEMTVNSVNNFYFLLGQEIQNSESKETAMVNRYFPVDITADKALAMMAQGSNLTASSSVSTPNRMASFFGQVNYNYAHRYLFSVTARADGTSYYAPGNKWGFFPSVSGGWVISDEPFWEGLKSAIDNLKLRVAVGKAGKNLTKADMWNYAYTVSTSGGPDFGNQYTTNGATYYSMSSYLPNPDIKWETTLTRNFAADISLFNGRVRLTPEYYWNTTSDLLHESQVLTNTGYTKQWRNIGQITNRGFELAVDADIVRGRDYVLSFNLSLGANKMKVDKLNGTDTYLSLSASRGGFSSAYNPYRLEVGQEVGLLYGFVYDGIYTIEEFQNAGMITSSWTTNQTEEELQAAGIVVNQVLGSSRSGISTMPGKIKFKDLNGDGVVDANDMTVIGRTTPRLQGGFGLSGQWKNFDLTANFTYFLNFDVYNATAQALSMSNTTDNLSSMYNVLASFTEGRWRYTEHGYPYRIYANSTLYADPTAEWAALNADATIWNPADLVTMVPFSYFVEDGSFLRCNDITVGYTLPSKISAKAGMSRLRFYGAVSNPFIITSYSGYDPEVDVMSGLTPSMDYNRYPRSRSYTVGVNVTF